MASYPATVYRWDDSGAPQLVNGKISSFFDVLQKCLVEGYGEKSPLGWTRSYYDPVNFKAAWRNSVADGGSGGSAYFYSNTNTDADRTVIRQTSCINITDTGVITKQGRLTTLQIGSFTNSGWVLIGTPIGFYFYSFMVGPTNSSVSLDTTSSSSNRISFYAGDLFSIVPNDAGRFVYYSGNSNSAGNNFPSGDLSTAASNISIGSINTSPNVQSNGFKIYDVDGSNDFTVYGYAGMLNTGVDGSSNDTSVAPLIYPKLLTNVLIKHTGNLNDSTNTDRNGIPIKISPTRPGIRGVLPGLFCTHFAFGYGQPLPFILTEDGVTYHALMAAASNSASCFIINAEVWDDPFI